MTENSPRFTRLAELTALAGLAVAYLIVRPHDARLFLGLNNLHTPFTDELWWMITNVGDGLVLGVLLGALTVVRPRAAVMGVIVLVVSSVLVHGLKAAFATPRPWACLESVHVVDQVLRSGSFPSGHAAAGLAAGLAVARYGGSRVAGMAAIALGVLIGLSRVFVGAHFPGDVIAGMAAAIAVFLLVDLVVGDRVNRAIPDRPDTSLSIFRAAVVTELLVAAGTALIYGPLFSPYPSLAVSMGLFAFVFVAVRWRAMRPRPTGP